MLLAAYLPMGIIFGAVHARTPANEIDRRGKKWQSLRLLAKSIHVSGED